MWVESSRLVYTRLEEPSRRVESLELVVQGATSEGKDGV